jgi:hypothetical protein
MSKTGNPIHLAASLALCLVFLQTQAAAYDQIAQRQETDCMSDHVSWERVRVIRIDPKALAFQDLRFDREGFLVSFTYVPRDGEICETALVNELERRFVAYIRNSWDDHTRIVIAALQPDVTNDPSEAFDVIVNRVGESAVMFLRGPLIGASPDPESSGFISGSISGRPRLSTEGYYAWMAMRTRIAEGRSELARVIAEYATDPIITSEAA